jgi:hypothetical protein
MRRRAKANKICDQLVISIVRIFREYYWLFRRYIWLSCGYNALLFYNQITNQFFLSISWLFSECVWLFGIFFEKLHQ